MLRGIVIYKDDRESLEAELDKTKPKVLGDDAATILGCIFTVNRSAKRHRDAAASCYESSMHGLAGHNKRQKQDLYDLKDRGIVYAVAQGWMQAVVKHGGLCLWQGGGYSFHSTLAPPKIVEAEEAGNGRVFVEAKPRESKEPRLQDAIATLEALPALAHNLARLSMPRIRREVVCYNCGEEGHIASECPESEEEFEEVSLLAQKKRPADKSSTDL